jgi:hypothetical protein
MGHGDDPGEREDRRDEPEALSPDDPDRGQEARNPDGDLDDRGGDVAQRISDATTSTAARRSVPR